MIEGMAIIKGVIQEFEGRPWKKRIKQNPTCILDTFDVFLVYATGYVVTRALPVIQRGPCHSRSMPGTRHGLYNKTRLISILLWPDGS